MMVRPGDVESVPLPKDCASRGWILSRIGDEGGEDGRLPRTAGGVGVSDSVDIVMSAGGDSTTNC
jgi:hypothetical protein